jgi:CBS-domain-containing membrane protein
MKNFLVDDVMTTAVVTARPDTEYRALVDLIVKHRFSAVPVVDEFQRVTGVVSEADLLRKIEYAGAEDPRLFEGRRRRGERRKAAGRTAAELMSTPPVTIGLGSTITAAARLMDDEGVKRLPVVDDLGRLVGIVSRGDLLKVHLRPDDAIRADVQRDVLRAHLADAAAGVQLEVQDGVVDLSGRVERWSAADRIERLSRQVPGVVDVRSSVTYDFDDRALYGPGTIIGVA